MVSQYLRGKRVPSPATTLYYGLNSSYAVSQILFAALALFAIRQGLTAMGHWSGLALGLLAACAWLFSAYVPWLPSATNDHGPLCTAPCRRRDNRLLAPIDNPFPKAPGNSMKLEGRTILITGGTSGIGFEIAKQLLARGNTVIITGRDQRKLKEAETALPGIPTFRSDASKPEDIRSLLQRVTAEFPDCDTLINNAGIMRNLNMNDSRSLTDVTRELDINLNGPVQMVQEFLPHFKSRPNALIVNVSSGLAFIPFPSSPIYSAAKTGLHAFTRCLRVQLKGSNVAVVELAPPGVETKLFRGEIEAEMKEQKGMAVDFWLQRRSPGSKPARQKFAPASAMFST